MRIITIASLGASAVLGVAALFVARTWLPVDGASTAAAAAPAPRNLTTIVVAAAALPYGSRLEAKSLELVQIPKEAAPESAFTTIDSVLKQDDGAPPVTITAIAAREPILPAKITGPGARPSVAAQITEGKRAYAIRVSDVSGVGGNILPGDHVDIVLMRDLTREGGRPNFVSEIVLQNVKLLGLDLNADPGSTETSVRSTATIEVTVSDAQKLAIVSQMGALSLALRRLGATDEEAAKPLRTTDMRLAGGGGPAPSASATALARPAAPKRPSVVIVSGDQRKAVEVPAEASRGGI